MFKMQSTGNSFLRRLDQHQHHEISPQEHEDRLTNIQEEQGHADSAATSHRELLKAKLQSLRGLMQSIQADNWMFIDDNKKSTGNPWER